jgi:hypothetical protein
MVVDRTRELLFPITILVSVAVGVGIGTVFSRTGNDTRASIGSSGSDSKSIVDAVDAVRAELVRVRERLDASSMSVTQTERTDTRSTASPDATAEIHKATAALVQATDSLRAASVRAESGRAPLVAPPAVDPNVWTELKTRNFAENTKSYILWNYQQVMDRFGPPDQFGTDNSGTYWLYRTGPHGNAFFRFTEGLVNSVQMND